jgi:hypothetical protein
VAEARKKGPVLGLEAVTGGPSADRSLEMLADGTLVTVFMGESWRSFSLEQWDALHEAGQRLLAGEQGRKVVEMASVADPMSLFQLAADIEDCLGDAVSLDGMTDAQWLRVARVIDGAGTRSLLEELWDAAGKARAGEPPHRALPGEEECPAEDHPFLCSAQKGHAPPHQAHGPADRILHAWGEVPPNG